jgi:hypothetical protein
MWLLSLCDKIRAHNSICLNFLLFQILFRNPKCPDVTAQISTNYYFSNFNGTHPRIVEYEVEPTDGADILLLLDFIF